MLVKDLDNFQSKVFQLYQLSDALTKNIDSISIGTITSQQSAIEHRLMILRQTISKQVQVLQEEISQKQGFHVQLKRVAACLNNVCRVLEKEEMNLSTDEQALNDRLDEMKNALVQMDDAASQLDHLNDLGYRGAVSEEISKELLELNRLWVNTHLNLQAKAKSLQDLLLVHKDFKTKCGIWLTFLQQMEADLSTEIAGNLPGLQEQLKQCEVCGLHLWNRKLNGQIMINVLSSPELKTGVNRSDFTLSIYKLNIFNFFSRTTIIVLVLIKLGTIYPWERGIQVYSNEGQLNIIRISQSKWTMTIPK
jgi:hypothetical protein